MKDVSISVLIPTARETSPKRGTLRHIVAPAIARLPIGEVCVVGRPGKEFLDGIGELKVPVRVIYDDNLERNHLRNAAMDQAAGTHIMYLDDDTILLPHGSLASRVENLAVGEMLTFAERKHLPLDTDFHAFYERGERLNWSRRVRSFKSLIGIPWREAEWYTAEISFPTNFCVLLRRTLEQIGGLDEDFVGWGYEDIEFANRVLRDGRILCCRNDATAVHINHLVAPDVGMQAYANYRRFLEKCQADQARPRWSAMYFGVAANFVDKFATYVPLCPSRVARALEKSPYLSANEADRLRVAEAVCDFCSALDVLAVGISGSASRSTKCRDVDVCVITGYCEDSFIVEKLPSGKVLELQLTSLSSVRRQLRSLYYLGDNAFLLYFKFRDMRLVYDYNRIVSRYLRRCLRGDENLQAYLMSYYVGAAFSYLEKKASAEQLVVGRYLAAVGLLSGDKGPRRDVALDPIAAKRWLMIQVRQLTARYRRAMRNADKKRVLMYPPNITGDQLLTGGGE